MAEMLKELQVLNEVAQQLAGLTIGEQRRIVVWLADYFDIYDDDLYDTDYVSDEELAEALAEAAVAAEDEALEAVAEDDEEEDTAAPEEDEAEDAPLTWAALYERVAPKTAIQKIITAAYWLETQEDKDLWKSFETNKLLKALDVKVSSVSGTLALDAKRDDPLTETLSKSGDSMQARKTFRLSDAGFAWVEDRLK